MVVAPKLPSSVCFAVLSVEHRAVRPKQRQVGRWAQVRPVLGVVLAIERVGAVGELDEALRLRHNRKAKPSSSAFPLFPIMWASSSSEGSARRRRAASAEGPRVARLVCARFEERREFIFDIRLGEDPRRRGPHGRVLVELLEHAVGGAAVAIGGSVASRLGR